MSRSSHFEAFQDHTRLKHYLLDVYLKAWATILITGRKPAQLKGLHLWFVDAFAGAGRDKAGAPGSPIIAARIAADINKAHFSSPLGKDEGMRVVAIEADEGRCTTLKEHLSQFPEIALVRHGQLDSIVDRFLAYVKDEPVLFFLDPFGVDGLDAAILPKLLDGPRREILLLFSDEGAVRLAGKARAKAPSRETLLAEHAPELSVFGEEHDAELQEEARLSVERVIAGHQSNDRAREILDRAFGGSGWQDRIKSIPAAERREAFVAMYEEVLRNAGATHVLHFAVTTEAGRHKYTLMHASKHPSAYVAMKEAMHRARRSRSQPEASQSLFEVGEAVDLGPEISSTTDLSSAVDQVETWFMGRSNVRWTGGNEPREFVRAFALRSTPLLVHELDALQHELTRRGRLDLKPDGKKSSPVTFSFPSR